MRLRKDARIKAGLSQRELAEKIGVGQTAVGNYESGLRAPSLEKAIKIYKVLRAKNQALTFCELWEK